MVIDHAVPRQACRRTRPVMTRRHFRETGAAAGSALWFLGKAGMATSCEPRRERQILLDGAMACLGRFGALAVRLDK